MTLATHAVVGGAVASLFPNHPITAFFAGFFMHYVFDLIPHWDYKFLSTYADPKKFDSLNEVKADKLFVFDLLRMSADMLLGVLITLAVWRPINAAQFWILALGAFGGILPDLLQFVYMRFPHQPMVFIQKFHNLMHEKYKLSNKLFLGALSQVAIMVLVILLVKYLIQF